jgi:hypothetical protein
MTLALKVIDAALLTKQCFMTMEKENWLRFASGLATTVYMIIVCRKASGLSMPVAFRMPIHG